MNLPQQIADDFLWYWRGLPGHTFWGALSNRHFWLVATYRFGAWAVRLRVPVVSHLARLIYVIVNLFISTITGADIRPGARIGRCFTVHTGRGLLITNGVVIGNNCTVNNGVCIVNRANDGKEGVPRIGNHVRIGVGAKILGGVHIRDYTLVGANAVVLKDVPSHHLAAGVPAVNKPTKFWNNTEYWDRHRQNTGR
jgi:serine O-acetyltransferase